jgi:hypothetical protein
MCSPAFTIKGGTMAINKINLDNYITGNYGDNEIFKCSWCEIKMHKSYESPRISKGERVCKDCNNTFLVLDVSYE